MWKEQSRLRINKNKTLTVVTTLVITTLVIKSKMVNNGILLIMKMRRIRIMIKRNTCSILATNIKEQCSWLGQ